MGFLEDLPVLVDIRHGEMKREGHLEVPFRKIHFAKHMKTFRVCILQEMEAICF